MLVLDLSETTFFSTSAFAVLVDARLNAWRATRLRLVAQASVRRMLRMLGLEPQFSVFDRAQDASPPRSSVRPAAGATRRILPFVRGYARRVRDDQRRRSMERPRDALAQ
ncbi:STAS domain-containing protein [Amycolatopsis sp. FDAARGOS 1241]|uniref:STAS domain-containing protein n=1 Tax=Amycolatopsis sp. FDAARGOS 1241 TaxID=2778070 RepID=UPI001EF2AD9E|nr:STAS domain-containing protein [Amycolatopsis sp. FDAARGOS 1241]